MTTTDENTNSWQNMYEQLQEIIVCCNQWTPRWNSNLLFDTISCFEEWFMIINDYNWDCETYSYHDLFSKDSGLMEFVEWKQTLPFVDADISFRYHTMSTMKTEQKVQYFLDNAIVPTLKEEVCKSYIKWWQLYDCICWDCF